MFIGSKERRRGSFSDLILFPLTVVGIQPAGWFTGSLFNPTSGSLPHAAPHPRFGVLNSISEVAKLRWRHPDSFRNSRQPSELLLEKAHVRSTNFINVFHVVDSIAKR